jgi:hypothetical protein
MKVTIEMGKAKRKKCTIKYKIKCKWSGGIGEGRSEVVKGGTKSSTKADTRGNTKANTKADTKGSITVEACIIVPLVILSIVAAVYMGLLLYQRALVQSAAEDAAEAGASAWSYGTCNVVLVKPDKESFEEFKLYRRLFDSDKETRLKNIEEYALSMAQRHELIKPLESSAQAVMKDYAVYRKLEVKICKSYNLPFGKFMKIFGGSDTIEIELKAVCAIDEPVELIRTTDFIIDIERKLENQFPQIKNLGEKSRTAINEIKGRLEQFMD